MIELIKKEWRFYSVAIFLLVLVFILLCRMALIQVLDVDGKLKYIQKQGDARILRTEKIEAHRGMITDRNGLPLAVSSPVINIFMNPRHMEMGYLDPHSMELGYVDAKDENAKPISETDIKKRLIEKEKISQIASYIGLTTEKFEKLIVENKTKQVKYLKQKLPPEEAKKILALKVSGIYGEEKYQRFYPAGEVTAHLVGYTNSKENGAEGMELAYNKDLKGGDGNKQIVKDLKGNTIKIIKQIEDPVAGKDLALSIDLRLQYLAYRALKVAIKNNNADAGSIVMLDVRTGEVLAMVNQPAFNPNDRKSLLWSSIRNRAMTDTFEPGSTMKPLAIIAALESGKYKPDTKIETHPGSITVSGKTLYDHNNYGLIDVTKVITKSSQVGITKITLSLEQKDVSNAFERMGIGQLVGTGFPGEVAGSLPVRKKWSDIERAAFAFGNGVSVNTLQLARAYAIFANNGIKLPISLLKQEKTPVGERVVSEDIARQIDHMLETVATPEGTARKAKTDSYSVAGKTGTSHKISPNGGYEAKKYISFFAGFSPVESPRIVAVVVVDNPKGKEYYGGAVAAPIFSEVVSGSLRMLNVAPDIDLAAEKMVAMDVGRL